MLYSKLLFLIIYIHQIFGNNFFVYYISLRIRYLLDEYALKLNPEVEDRKLHKKIRDKKPNITLYALIEKQIFLQSANLPTNKPGIRRHFNS